MATRPKIPKFDAPFLDKTGRLDKQWFNELSQTAHVGTPATTATAGAGTLPATPEGFITIFVNGTEMKVPFYKV